MDFENCEWCAAFLDVQATRELNKLIKKYYKI